MTSTDTHAEHTTDQRAHGDGCGHDTVQHDDHPDHEHDGHRHAVHSQH